MRMDVWYNKYLGHLNVGNSNGLTGNSKFFKIQSLRDFVIPAVMRKKRVLSYIFIEVLLNGVSGRLKKW